MLRLCKTKSSWLQGLWKNAESHVSFQMRLCACFSLSFSSRGMAFTPGSLLSLAITCIKAAVKWFTHYTFKGKIVEATRFFLLHELAAVGIMDWNSVACVGKAFRSQLGFTPPFSYSKLSYQQLHIRPLALVYWQQVWRKVQVGSSDAHTSGRAATPSTNK